MGIFTHIFFSWYRSNRHSVVVLLYGLSFAVIVITSSVLVTISFYRFMEKPLYIFPYSKVVFVKFEEGSVLYNLREIYHYSGIVSFILKWVCNSPSSISLFTKDRKNKILGSSKSSFGVFSGHFHG